ncbi:sensor histidine kinase [Lachnospira pectinoschiza]|uniref:histidine kinase n=1 Tax=Lachnospira pectinoschiza TaxID=28052 RepID=A0A1G9VX08_9FIRM|nr:ATP-binding protein [Lachnospira pectinoschiza]SDM76819.1 Signal transduction histidine kinase [Lachnospira pectinoschiza]
MGIHSIRFKITLLLVAIVASLIVLLLVINVAFAEKFYISGKQETMSETYDKINEIMLQYDDGDISKSTMMAELDGYVSGNAMTALVVDSSWSTVYVSNSSGDDRLLQRLMLSILTGGLENVTDSSSENATEAESQSEDNTENKSGSNSEAGDAGSSDQGDKNNSDAGSKNEPPEKEDQSSGDGGYKLNYDKFDSETSEVLQENSNYTIQKIYDSVMADYYLELWGTLDNGDSIIVRLPIQSIKDNIEISNTLIRYVGLSVLAIGVIAVFIFSAYISKPIKQLAHISERMSELDFNVRYTGKDKGEVGLLGHSMNNMSAKLEDNISRLKSANLELKRDIDKKEQIEKMRTDFLSNVSHELKTPIALIQGYAEGLKDGIADDKESRDFYLDVITDEANKMSVMVKRLLTLNQLEFGDDELVMERFNINDLLQSVVNANSLRAKQNDIKIIYESSDINIDVWGDEYKIEEVVTNYITNAINHCANEKEIRVKLERPDDKNVRVSVFNTGNPIPAEDIDRIWEKFYKVDKARTREYGGNGIGLSIVKAIMTSMGKGYGARNVSNGVEFWFDLDCDVK